MQLKIPDMVLQDRINGFIHLGKVLDEFSSDGKEHSPEKFLSPEMKKSLDLAIRNSSLENAWFTRENVMFALRSIALNLKRNKLDCWLQQYKSVISNNTSQKTIAVIMAGNIPMVGFHDFLCVLLSGNRFLGKLSSDDRILLPALASILTDYDSGWDQLIAFTQETIRSFDAVIATGSNSSSHYFRFYFSAYPHIIRKNRNSVAVITGEETTGDLANLAKDIFLYFGMGCRSVSKIFVPVNYDFSGLVKAFAHYDSFLDHHKYRNNFDYFKAIFQMNLVPFIDSTCVLLKEDVSVSSPIAVLNYQYYTDLDILRTELSSVADSIQCAVSIKEMPFRWSRPGNAQSPELWDYADGIDTMQFLTQIK